MSQETFSNTASDERIEGDADDEDVKNMMKVITDNQNTYTQRSDEIKKLRDFRNKPFKVSNPKGNKWVSSLQPIQIVNDILQKLKRPSLSYQSDGLDPKIAQIIRDAVNTIKEEGGFTAVLTEKPSQYRDAISYGDGFCRIGFNKNADFPFTFDNVIPDKIYVDSNATIMHSKNQNRAVTRIVVVYSYDKDQANKLYPDKNFGKGKIPTSDREEKDFEKTYEQDADAETNDVEFAHYFDIGGKEPIYLVCAGDKLKIVERMKGKDFPFIDKNEKPKIPIGHLRGSLDADEGFFNYGLLHVLYQYMIARQQLFNKQFSQGIRAMTDLSVLNTGGSLRSGVALKRIRDAKKIAKEGEMALIINDKGEQMSVTKLEAQQFETSLEAIEQKFDKELKRLKINLDAIRESRATTATQILSEAEAEDEHALDFINRNTAFFKFIDEMIIDLIREHVKPDDKTPIRTNVKIPKVVKDETGAPLLTQLGELQVERDSLGNVIEETVSGITLGDVKQLLDKYNIFLEVNTKSGVRQRDSLKTARALLGLRVSPNPRASAEYSKKIAEANDIEIDPSLFMEQEAVKPSPAGIEKAAEAVTEEKI